MFGDDGPSEAEIEENAVKKAKKREQDVRAFAAAEANKGVNQLFGPNNPALAIPGGTNA